MGIKRNILTRIGTWDREGKRTKPSPLPKISDLPVEFRRAKAPTGDPMTVAMAASMRALQVEQSEFAPLTTYKPSNSEEKWKEKAGNRRGKYKIESRMGNFTGEEAKP